MMIEVSDFTNIFRKIKYLTHRIRELINYNSLKSTNLMILGEIKYTSKQQIITKKRIVYISSDLLHGKQYIVINSISIII